MPDRARLAALARPLIAQPTRSAGPPASWRTLAWPELLLARGWLRRAEYEAAEEPTRQAALELLTSGLTFPLTLASTLQSLCSEPSRPLRLCVVGARAEAGMPLHMWDEVQCLTSRETPLALHMVGPKATGTSQRREGGRLLSVTQEAALFHETALGRALLGGEAAVAAAEQELPTAFLLFNPGLGEPGWGRAWGPTVRALLASRRPVLLTALSTSDAEQDVAFWAQQQEEQLQYAGGVPGLVYAPNPWASTLPSQVRGGEAASSVGGVSSNHLVALHTEVAAYSSTRAP